MQKIKSMLFRAIPPYNTFLYEICNRYVDRYHNNADSRMERNGELNFLKQISPNLQVVFDVGANIGEWTTHLLSYNPAIQVHCFEPSPTTFAILQKKNMVGDILYNNIGLSSEERHANLHILHDGAGGNSLYKQSTADIVKQEIVQLTTLDQYCQKKEIEQIDLLKIDVEGHEFEILKGGHYMFQTGAIKMVQFEYNQTFIDAHVFLKDIFDYLQPFAYRFYKIYPEQLRECAHYDYALDNFRYQNWVASRISLL